jgi:hypothetical protein
MTGLGRTFFHGASLCTVFNQKQSETVRGRPFFENPKTWDPTLFWGVNQLGAGQRVERVSAEKRTKGRFWEPNRGQGERKRESPDFYGIVISRCGCLALEKCRHGGGALTKFSPISRL